MGPICIEKALAIILGIKLKLQGWFYKKFDISIIYLFFIIMMNVSHCGDDNDNDVFPE